MKTPASPKLLAGGNAALILGLVVTLLGSLGPGSLDFLGNWAPLAYSVVAIVTFAIAGYLKTDSLRDAGLAALQKAAEEAAAAVEATKQTSLAATAVNGPATSSPASFAPTQAKIDVLPAPTAEPVTETPAPAAPVAPLETVIIP